MAGFCCATRGTYRSTPSGGCVLVAAGLQTVLRQRARAAIGNLEMIGPDAWWTVDAHRVTRLRLAGLLRVDGTHQFANGVYRHNNLMLNLGTQQLPTQVKPRHKAEEIARLSQCRGPTQARRSAAIPPAVRPQPSGAWALCIAPVPQRVDRTGGRADQHCAAGASWRLLTSGPRLFGCYLPPVACWVRSLRY